jgi:hypothetical protein
MRTATFENSVSVLVKAYLNETLTHGDCLACAVGNLVSAACNYDPIDHLFASTFDIDGGYKGKGWAAVFCTIGDTDDDKRQYIRQSSYTGEAKEQIDATGYTWQQLAKIEKAFELAPKGKNDDEWMFNGLMSVVDVLAEIHNVDLTTKESAKLLFIKP